MHPGSAQSYRWCTPYSSQQLLATAVCHDVMSTLPLPMAATPVVWTASVQAADEHYHNH